MQLSFREIEVMEKFMYQYFDAVLQADVAVLRKLYHEKACIFGEVDGVILVGDPEPLYEYLLAMPSMQEQGIDCRPLITHMEVTGNIGAATLLLDNYYGKVNMENHYHLLKDEEGWRIVCSTFTTLARA